MTDPLVPAEVDLRDFAFMPLEFRRLFASETWILGTPDERCAAFCLWCESWHQIPAASLPDNDRMLAHLSQAGARWPKVKAHVMRSWVKCNDGRLYHSVVAEKALEAWEKHKKASSKGKAGASKRWGTRNSAGNGTGINQPLPTDSNRSEKNGNEKTPTPTPAASPPPAVAVADPVFGDGLELLKSKGLQEQRARKFLGLQRQKYGDLAVAEVVAEAAKNDITDPIPWFIAALERHAKSHKAPSGTAMAILALENMK